MLEKINELMSYILRASSALIHQSKAARDILNSSKAIEDAVEESELASIVSKEPTKWYFF